MNIMMLTNTFTPHVGGVARSVERFTAEYRRLGHRVLIVAPVFEGMPEEEKDVVRIPAIQRFNGSDFSVVLPVPNFLGTAVEEFQPNVIHSHHPFLLGSTALRLATTYNLPLVFTHHTMYEQYTHYVPGDSETMKKFAINLATMYANLCNRVIAPSESIRQILLERGVTTPVDVVPTGLRLEDFRQSSGPGMRMALNIPLDAFLIGHLGRLAPEKNLDFLARAVVRCLKDSPQAHFLLVGSGPSLQGIKRIFEKEEMLDRLHHVGLLELPLLAGAYQAMDVFAFASKSETQGMVVTEAMAAGVPVVALDAPGVREVVEDRVNGRLLFNENLDDFAAALADIARSSPEELRVLQEGAERTAQKFSLTNCAQKALRIYKELEKQDFVEQEREYQQLGKLLRSIKAEWDVMKTIARAASSVLISVD